ncbi:hypothetical protein SNEBB_000947, partial [Seison nebaliae]
KRIFVQSRNCSKFKKIDSSSGDMAGSCCNVVNDVVPHSSLGLVIGKGGSNIRDLEERFNCRINLDKNNSTEMGVPLRIAAKAENAPIEEAAKAIRQQIEEQTGVKFSNNYRNSKAFVYGRTSITSSDDRRKWNSNDKDEWNETTRNNNYGRSGNDRRNGRSDRNDDDFGTNWNNSRRNDHYKDRNNRNDNEGSKNWNNCKTDDNWNNCKTDDNWNNSKTDDNWNNSKMDDNWNNSKKNDDNWNNSKKTDDNWNNSKMDDNWNNSKMDDNWNNSKKTDDNWGNSKNNDNWGNSKKTDSWRSNKNDDNWGNIRDSGRNENSNNWSTAYKKKEVEKSEGWKTDGGWSTNDWNNSSKNNFSLRDEKKNYRNDNNSKSSFHEKKDESFYNSFPSNDNENNKDLLKSLENSDGSIDWGAIREEMKKPASLERWTNYQKEIIKDTYHIHEEVEKMTREDVEEFRKEALDLMVLEGNDLQSALQQGTTEDGHAVADISNIKISSESSYENVMKPCKTFYHAFHSQPQILEEMMKAKFEKPSPIQSQAWPIALSGRDFIGIAQTGTGKTLAFLLPAMIHICAQTQPIAERLGPNILVLSPTRELAQQIEREIAKYSFQGIRSLCIYGGGDRRKQIEICRQGVQVVIATPGRLWDLQSANHIDVKSVTFLVLDEADRLLDLGFEPQILKILLDIRPDRQTIMTSATWPIGVQRLAKKYFTNPVYIRVGSLELSTVKTVEQKVMLVNDDEKESEILKLLRELMRQNESILIFFMKKVTCDFLAAKIGMKEIYCEVIHGGRDQIDREQALENMRNGDCKLLLATDVAARGIDIPNITVVINYDFPKDMSEYVHRVGRTGRAGRKGTAISFFTKYNWSKATELIRMMEEHDQLIPDFLRSMSQRFIKHQEENPKTDRFNNNRRRNRY